MSAGFFSASVFVYSGAAPFAKPRRLTEEIFAQFHKLAHQRAAFCLCLPWVTWHTLTFKVRKRHKPRSLSSDCRSMKAPLFPFETGSGSICGETCPEGLMRGEPVATQSLQPCSVPSFSAACCCSSWAERSAELRAAF